MGGLTMNRKRGLDNCSPNYMHSHNSKKVKISPLSDQIQKSSQKGKSRVYLYPEPVNKLKREVHAPCRVTKFTSFGIKRDNFNDFFGSRCELAKRVEIRSLRFSNKEDEDEVINVDDVANGDFEVSGNGDEMETELEEENADLNTEIENREMETESGERKLLENNKGIIENKSSSWDLVSLNEKRSLLGMPVVYKQLWEDAENLNPKLDNLSFQIELYEKKKLQLQLRRPVKQPEEEVVPEEVLQEAFVPLTKEEKAEVSRALSDSNSKKVLATHDNSNIAITGKILQCLRPTEWLNDEVINVYLELLKERERRDPKRFLKCHFFNTFFYKKLTSGQNTYDYKSVRRWTTQRKLGYALIDCEKIFVPIHKPYHWCLAVINKKDKKFQYLDSLGGTDSYVLKALARYYVEEVRDKSGENIDVSSWKQEYVKDLPVQKNGFDCGVFMVKYTDFYSRGMSLCFKQDDMPYFRERTAKEILRLRAE